MKIYAIIMDVQLTVDDEKNRKIRLKNYNVL